MGIDLAHSGQRGFLELHALLAEPEVGDQIRQLAKSEVAPHRILALYPFSTEDVAERLKLHLHSTLRLGSFVWLVNNFSRLDRYINLRDAVYKLPPAGGLAPGDQLKREWSNFCIAWHSPVKSSHDLDADQDRYFALLDAFEMLWISARWHELPALHGKVKNLDWALSELHAALHFMNHDGPMQVDGPHPTSGKFVSWVSPIAC